MAERTTGQKIANAMAGFGAGYQGRGGAFLALQENQRRLSDEERRQALLEDAYKAWEYLNKGDVPGAQNVFLNRFDRVRQSGGDPKDTLEMIEQLDRGNIEAAKMEIDAIVNHGFATGRLDPRLMQSGGTTYRGTKGDQAIVQNPDGSFEAVGIANIASETGRDPEQVQRQVNTLRTSVKDAEKSFRAVEEARNRIVRTGSRGTAASDLSLIFNFMKMNDPGSTVREGEFANAQNSAGVPGRIVSLYNNLLEGTRLSPEQRRDFIAQSEGLFESQRYSLDSRLTGILEQADTDQIPRVRVLGDTRLKAYQKRRAEKSYMSSKLGRKVSLAELEEEAQRENMTVDELKVQLGID